MSTTSLSKRIFSIMLCIVMALSLLPNVVWAKGYDSAVAKINDTQYATLADAIGAANTGDTVEILVSGTYKLPNIPKNITIDATVDGVVFDCVGTGSICSISNGATFKNAAFEMGQASYHGFQHAGTLNFDGCAFTGMFFSYGDMNFTDCVFTQTEKQYVMWAYGGDLVYDGCTFDLMGKGVNVYNESGNVCNITVKDCDFNSSVTNKSAFNIKETCGSKVLNYTVTFEGNNTANENFPTDKVGGSKIFMVDDQTKATVTEGGLTINVVDEKGNVTCVYSSISYVAQIGDTQYATLADALKNAQDNDVVELLWDEGDAPIDMQGSVYGKTVTITGTAQVDWSKGWLFVGRGGEGDGTLIFDNANLTTKNDNDSAPKSTGINVSGHKKGSATTCDGTLVIKNSSIVLDYLISKNNVEVIGNGTVGTTPDLLIKGGFGVAGRPADETENGKQATATIDLKDGAYVKILNPNGMGVGCASGSPEGFGVMNIDSTSKVETASPNALEVYANVGTLNSAGDIFGKFTAQENATVSITGGTYEFDPTAYVVEGFKATDNGNGTWTVGTIHNLTKTDAHAANCTQVGNTEYYTCQDCGKYFADAQATKEISANSWVIHSSSHQFTTTTVDATCECVGYTIHACKNCDFSYISDITPALGHTIVTDKAVAPTCSKTGLTAGSHCSVCHKVFVAQETVPMRTLAKPVITSLTNGKTGITICWNAVDGADGYQIYRKIGNGQWTLYKTITDGSATKCANTNRVSGTKYQYKLVATAGKNVSAESAAATMYFLARPDIYTHITSSGIQICWDAVPGADGYKIYRKTVGGEWKQVKTVSGSTTWTDSKCTNGTQYQYRVKAYTSANDSVYNSAVSTYKVRYYLSRPTVSSVANAATAKITVKWSKNSAVSGYQVRYTVDGNSQIVTVKGANTVSKTISKLTKGKTYTVKVRAYKTLSDNSQGAQYSAWSTAKSVKVAK